MDIKREVDMRFSEKLTMLFEQEELSSKDVMLAKKLLGNKWKHDFWEYETGTKESFCPFDSSLLKGLEGMKTEMQSDCARFSHCKKIVSWILAQAYKVNTIYMVAMMALDLDGLIDLSKVGTVESIRRQARVNCAIIELNDNIFTILAGLFYSFNL